MAPRNNINVYIYVSFFSFRFITAASDGDLAVVGDYLKDGLDVNSQDWDKLTALIASASQGHLQVVKLLLDKASGVDGVDPVVWLPCVLLFVAFSSEGVEWAWHFPVLVFF